MFFAITFLVGFLLTAFFGPKPKIENAKSASLGDFNFPRAAEGDPVPRWYGTNKFQGPNTIWQGDFRSKAITKKVKTGLFSSKKQTTGYQYFVGLDLAVCLGPNFTYRRIWAGKYELWNGCLSECQNVLNINRPDLFGGADKNGGWTGNVALYCGAFDQPQDSYLISKIGADVPAYVGITHMVFRQCYWGNSPNIEPIYIEGSCFTNSLNTKYSVMPNGLDTNPAEVLYDLAVNDWGNLEVDPALINVEQWRGVAKKLFEEKNGMSIVVANSNTGADVWKQILKQINGTVFQNPSTGLFELVLIRKDYDVTKLPRLGPNQISAVTSFTKKLWSETNNRVRVKFTDRKQDWKDNVVAQADDFANIRFQKRINPVEFSFPTIFDADLANEVAARELANLNVPLYQAEITVDRSVIDLLPGGVFVMDWPEYNVANLVMRVRKVGLGTLNNGAVTLGIVQDEFSSDAVVVGTPSNEAGPPPDFSPKPISEIDFELPYWLRSVSGLTITEGTPHFAFLAVDPSPYSQSYNFVAQDTGEDAQILSQEPYSPNAKLAEALEQYAGFETGVLATLKVKSISDPDLMGDYTDETVRKGAGLFYLNDELLAYTTSSDNGDGTWTLNEVHRALADTTWKGGAIDAPLYFIRDQIGFLPDPGEYTGKLQDVTGAGPYPLDMAEIVTLTGTGRADRPYAPDLPAIDGERALRPVLAGATPVTLTWIERNRLTAPDMLKFEDDATEAPEVGTVYIVKVFDEDGTEVVTSAELGTPEYELTAPADLAGEALIEVWAKRDGVLSYTSAPYPVMFGEFLKVDDDYLTVDGEKVEVK